MRFFIQISSTPQEISLNFFKSFTHHPWNLEERHKINREAWQGASNKGNPPSRNILLFPRHQSPPKSFLNGIPNLIELLRAPKGRPKYDDGRVQTLKPNSTTSSSTLPGSPTRKISFLSRLILKPDRASNHINSHTKLGHLIQIGLTEELSDQNRRSETEPTPPYPFPQTCTHPRNFLALLC